MQGAGNFWEAGTEMLRQRYPHGRSGSTPPLYTGAELACEVVNRSGADNFRLLERNARFAHWFRGCPTQLLSCLSQGWDQDYSHPNQVPSNPEWQQQCSASTFRSYLYAHIPPTCRRDCVYVSRLHVWVSWRRLNRIKYKTTGSIKTKIVRHRASHIAHYTSSKSLCRIVCFRLVRPDWQRWELYPKRKNCIRLYQSPGRFWATFGRFFDGRNRRKYKNVRESIH